MKIGYVLKRFPRFSETFILNEMLALERQGVAVEVYSLMTPPDEPRHAALASLAAPVFYLPKRGMVDRCRLRRGGDATGEAVGIAEMLQPGPVFPRWFPGADTAQSVHLCLQAAALAMLADARGIDHLHAHFASHATTVALLAARLAGIGFSFTAHARDIYHTYVDRAVDDALRRRKIAAADFVVTVSDYNREHLLGITGGRHAGKIHRLYNGVDLQRFRPVDGSRDPRCLVAVGRLVEKKGFRYLVEACHLLARNGVDHRCLIVGDGPQREALSRRIHELGLAGRVTLTGPQSQEALRDTLARAAAVVLPAVVSASGDRDGLPTVLLEAMAMGLPVISTRVAGIPEIIDDGENGRLVPEKNPEALADALAGVLADPRRAEAMGQAGREKATRCFDLDRNVATLKRLFGDAIARRRGERP